jgi:hypothetical protein
VYAGYLQQQYKKPFGSVTGVDFGAKLTWTPDALWTVSLDASHTINNTVVTVATDEDDSSIKLTADLQALPYLVIEGQGYFLNTKFSGAHKADNYYGVGLSAKYFLNQWMAVRAGYNFEQRTSNRFVGPSKQDFTDNQANVALLLQE